MIKINLFSAKLALLTITAVLMIACQKSDDSVKSDPRAFLTAMPDDQSLFKLAQKNLQNSVSYCDQGLKNHIEELTLFLDQNLEVIKGLAKADVEKGISKKVGPLILQTDFVDPNKPIQNKWQMEGYSWIQQYRDYIFLRDRKPSSQWLSLYRQTRHLIAVDKDRIAGVDFETLPDHELPMKEMINRIEKCKSDVNCTQIAKTDLYDFFEKQEWFSDKINDFNKASSAEDRKKALDKLAKTAQTIFDWKFKVEKRSFITRDQNKLIVKMDAGAFKGYEKEFSDIVEAKWSSADLSVKIDWQEKNKFLDIYTILVGVGEGNRAFVNDGSKTLNMFNGNRINTLSHEFGHVLGLPDSYFIYWDWSNCAYQIYSNNSDLMSDSTTGSVTPANWTKLKKLYP
jgi:hypothetical protein